MLCVYLIGYFTLAGWEIYSKSQVGIQINAANYRTASLQFNVMNWENVGIVEQLVDEL